MQAVDVLWTVASAFENSFNSSVHLKNFALKFVFLCKYEMLRVGVEGERQGLMPIYDDKT